ncbi:hypothetical protein BT96DRAFT_967566 [Gymnopus androsaceus JB14]|uniref:Mitotic checkpoint regulator, MAD2B-interacting-domain-containing protein n=1 Tax=Gymnopus androsaceus JB14 TaxID=1447944 RepID=A0A6A4H1L6_9AGAR|nr:hypothetical protein BT96DRAFT_967566 [Gymnopus androsaceus JB14]
MLGVEDYGSGSDSEGEGPSQPTQLKKSSLSLPPPSSSKAPGKTKKKIAIGLPSLKSSAPDEDELQSEMPPAKKPKLGAGAGAGSSSLLSMLPAPKQKAPIAAAPERVLGAGKGPGLVFNTSRPAAASSSERQISQLEEEKPRAITKVTSAPAVDFFGLTHSISISSAPAIPTFEVPEPTVSDPYPGYYQLPSGEWRQHDVEFYEKFRRRWEKEYNAHGSRAMSEVRSKDVDAAKEMERAKVEIKEREERKAVSKMRDGEPAKPKMTITASKMSGIARSRHQLATLLNEAYQNREALEEKIAEGRRNRKEAGNKYGMCALNLQ